MSERLTDDQLQRILVDPDCDDRDRVLVDEILAIRVKLLLIGSVLNEYANHPVVRMVTLKIASIK